MSAILLEVLALMEAGHRLESALDDDPPAAGAVGAITAVALRQGLLS